MYIVYLILGLIVGTAGSWYLLGTRLGVHNQALQTQLQAVQQQLEEKEVKLSKEREDSLNRARDVSRLETDNQHLSAKLKEQKQEEEAIQEKLTAQFKNLANELLEEKSKKFTDQNKVQLESILKPLGERIQSFEKQVAESNKEHLVRSVALRTEIKKLNELNTQITKEAENLAKAIKGDTKIQGNWGEFILESILEKSGLTKGREYRVQESFGAEVVEKNKYYRPDVIVKLPKNRHIIIDAKVSLVNYEQFFNAEEKEKKAFALKRHIQSVRNHIKTLSEKNYPNLYGIKSLDFVLMFIPLEPAFGLAVQNDLDIFNEAYKKNIVLVSPTTLMATLRTIANLWKHEYQNQNAMKIAQQGGALYDKFVGFVEDMKKLGKQVEATQETYEKTMNKLCEGQGNLVKKVEDIKALGARTSKSIDPQLVQ